MSNNDRWSEEQKYFDDVEYKSGPISQAILDRYIQCRKPYLPAEFPFWIIGDVRGKRILEVGCGDGGNSIILALKGATVVGMDISPRAIEIAKERARLHNVEDRVTFYAQPLELYLQRSPETKFDIICGFAVLHHVLPVLESILKDLKTLSRPDTVFLFVEPVSYSDALRKLRLALPIPLHATPDERPLEPRDLSIIESILPGLHSRNFGMFVRFWDRFLSTRYEEFSPFKRRLFDMMAYVDAQLLRIPGIRSLGSSVVLYSDPSRR